MKRIAKQLLSLTSYRISRGAPNRFDAIGHFVRRLAKMGYAPSLIIDGGAHTGEFALAAHAAFPNASLHMIDPQPACAAALKKLALQHNFHFYPVALTSERKTIRMALADRLDTGAHIPSAEHQHFANTDVQGDTLDALFSSYIGLQQRVFLKLDLQGHELHALRGARRLLKDVDFVLSEASFYSPTDRVSDLISVLDEVDFELFDIVGLAGRLRDDRARQGDFVFVRRGTPYCDDRSWI